MGDKYTGTMLIPKDELTPEQANKASLDLLKKINAEAGSSDAAISGVKSDLISNGTGVVESGGDSTAGYYQKFYDGTMIQRINKSFTYTLSAAYGNLYYGTDNVIAFAKSFIDTTYSLAPGFTSQGVGGCQIVSRAAGSVNMRPINGNNGTGFVIAYDIIAIGKWK